MTFIPSGVLRNDYSAFCESLRLIEREDMYSAILCQPRPSCCQQEEQEHEQQKEEVNKEEVVPLTHFTCVKMRHPSFCVNHRDVAPLTMAMPFCTSLVFVELTGCGLSELAYHKLVEAVYKSLRVFVVKVDFNSPKNKGFYDDPLLSNAGNATPTILLKPTEFCGLHCFPTALEEQIREEKQKKGKVDSKKIQQLQSQSELVEQFNSTHAFAIPKRWAGILLTGIAHLSLRGNSIIDDDVKVMVEIILSHKYLQLISLNLWDNKISDIGASELARLLRENNTLRMLDLGHNALTDHGMLNIIDTLRMQEVHGMNELLTRRRKVLTRPNALQTERQLASQPIVGNILSYQDLFNIWYVDHFPLSSISAASSSHLDEKSKENSNTTAISSVNNSSNNNNNKRSTSSSTSSTSTTSSSTANANVNATGSNNYLSSTSGGKNRNKTDPQQNWIAMIKQMVRPTSLFDKYCVKVSNSMSSLSSNTTMMNMSNTNSAMNNSTSNTFTVDDAQNVTYRVPGNTVIEILNLSENKHVTLNGVREVKRRLSLQEPHSEDEMMALTISKSTEEICLQCVLPNTSKFSRRKSSNTAQHLNPSMPHASSDNNNNYNTNTPSNRSLSQSNVEVMNKIPHVHVPEPYCVHLHLNRCDVRTCHEFNRSEWSEMNKLQEEINSLLAERFDEVNRQEDEIRARERADAEEAQRRAVSATPIADSRHGSAKRK